LFSIRANIRSDNNKQLVLSSVKDIIANTRHDFPSDMVEPVAKIVIHDYPLLLVAIFGDVSKKDCLMWQMTLKENWHPLKSLVALLFEEMPIMKYLLPLIKKNLMAMG
ncbi:MAG: AcrB/AcrD/AcrF family protein, partial [Sulfurovum sp.]|nr:AcrB/AcrD/AcrF family protein [Sulfurovum sp.]